MHWLSTNYQWIVAVVAMPILLLLLKQWADSRKKAPTPAPAQQTALNAQHSQVVNSPVATGSGINQNINAPVINVNVGQPPAPGPETPRCDFWLHFHPQGSRFLHIQNNGTEPAFDAIVQIPADGSGFKSDVIHRLDSDRAWVPCLLKGDFFSMESARRVLAETILHPPGTGKELKVIPVLIRYRTHTQHSCVFHLEIRLPLQNGIQFALPEVAEGLAVRAEVPEIYTSGQKDRQASAKVPTTDEDQSSWPDVILECQWPSLLHESRIPGTHIVRKRPWMLRYRGADAVYNVRVHRIDFGEYEAKFPFPVPTLIDTATVQPIICRKVDGRPDLTEVVTVHDLESLIHDPPSGCDVGQYAVEIDGTEDEEIPIGDFVLEVDIPVTVSYDDKNGNRFKIKYLLHYDTYTEEGQMIRNGRIEKVAPR